MSSFTTILCYNLESGICESYTVGDGTRCSDLRQGDECFSEGSINQNQTPPAVQNGQCYSMRSFGPTRIRWVNVYGQVVDSDVPANTTAYICSISPPVEIPNQQDLAIEQCGFETCQQIHRNFADVLSQPCGVTNGGVCSVINTPTTTQAPTGTTNTTTQAPESLVSAAELSSAFTWEFDSTSEPVIYRRYTTDAIPTYTISLKNLSTRFYIKVFNSPSYLLATNLETNTAFSDTNGILLAPLESKRISVSFATGQMDNQIANVSPQMGLRLQALVARQNSEQNPSITTTTTASPNNTQTQDNLGPTQVDGPRGSEIIPRDTGPLQA
jgi:hypothetical protein